MQPDELELSRAALHHPAPERHVSRDDRRRGERGAGRGEKQHECDDDLHRSNDPRGERGRSSDERQGKPLVVDTFLTL